MAGRLAAVTPKQRTCIAVGVLLLVVAIPLRGLLRRPGPPMEEGFMLVFAESFLRGDVPNKDFLHLYGPGGIWVLAGAFKLFGVSLLTERLVALVQLLGIIFGVFFLARSWGRTVALVCGVVTALVIIPPIGLTDLAWNGGIALGLLGCLAGLRAHTARTDRGRNALAITSGVLLGAAVLYRPDLILAVALALFFLVRTLDRPARRRLLIAGAATLGLFLVQFAMAGIGNSIQGMVIDPVFNLRGGRHLPLPPSWSHFDGFLLGAADARQINWPLPKLRAPAQLTVWFSLLVAAVAAIVWTARRIRKREPEAIRGLVLCVVAAFCVGILPQALQRPDSVHIAWVSCIPLGFLPVVGFELVRTRRPEVRFSRVLMFGVAPVLVLLYALVPNYLVRDYADVSLESFGIHRHAFEIEHDGRVFYYGEKSNVAELAKILPEADRIAKPGARLVVGTGDLRKTPLSEAFIYYLLPKTVPGTYYIEMDPGVANAKGSKLAGDLRHADLVILSRAWDKFDEPNDSRKLGSDAPNRVLRAKFCSVMSLEHYELLRRCRHGTGSQPSTATPPSGR